MLEDKTLKNLQNTYEERQCRVGSAPDWEYGIVEKVYQARNRIDGLYKCKVIMDNNVIKYIDINEIHIF